MNAIKAQLTELRFSVCSDDVLKIELSLYENHVNFHNEKNWKKVTRFEIPFSKIRLLLLQNFRPKLKKLEFWANFGENRIFGEFFIGRKFFFISSKLKFFQNPSVSVTLNKLTFFKFSKFLKKSQYFS